MGLDFSHSNAHWSYSGFYDFRRRLAQEINVDLEMMDGFGGDIPFDLIKDSIEPLLNHSDCGGGLTPADCARVAPMLRELVKGWADDDYDKRHALTLAEGMEEAIAEDLSLIHISEPTRLGMISYAVFCLKQKKK